jgi:cobalamin biosynthesis protein CobT
MHTARDARGFEFESALSKIARVLTGQYGVTVVFSPDGPRVERGRIVIPDYEVGDKLSTDVLVGYLDLLVARAKHSTLSQLEALPQGAASNLAQVIEDRRVCAQLLEEYPGARWFIGKLRAHAAARMQQSWNRLRWRDRFIWRVELALWDEPVMGGQASQSLAAALVATQDLIVRASRSRSTADSIAAAQEILARVRALSAGEVNNMMFSMGTAEDIDTDPLRSSFDPFESDGTRASEESAAPSPSDPSGAAEALNGAGMGHALADAQPLAARADSTAQTLRASARMVMSIPLATEFDVINDQLKEKLERALSADERTRWRREQERGEIDRPSLAKLATSPGYRTPFKVKRATKGRDVAVTLLIDRSGSMAGRKIELARLCAAALGDALTQLGFDCEVLGYSSIESPQMKQLYERQRAAGVDLLRYNRLVERLDLQIYKRFGSADLSGLTGIDCGHENPDGEALAWAATRLADHAAERRILMVFSDGYPATGDGDPLVLRSDLRQRVAAIQKTGIELVGVGVLTDAVEAFYPHNVVVSRLAELPSTVFSVLSSMLLKR